MCRMASVLFSISRGRCLVHYLSFLFSLFCLNWKEVEISFKKKKKCPLSHLYNLTIFIFKPCPLDCVHKHVWLHIVAVPLPYYYLNVSVSSELGCLCLTRSLVAWESWILKGCPEEASLPPPGLLLLHGIHSHTHLFDWLLVHWPYSVHPFCRLRLI